jgi:hypothetical protein
MTSCSSQGNANCQAASRIIAGNVLLGVFEGFLKCDFPPLAESTQALDAWSVAAIKSSHRTNKLRCGEVPTYWTTWNGTLRENNYRSAERCQVRASQSTKVFRASQLTRFLFDVGYGRRVLT